MSKRSADNFGGDEQRYGGPAPTDMDGNDKPVQATAAQLARRKLLKPRARTDRGRSDSPAVQPQNGFGQAAVNPFTSQSFNFSAQQPQQSNGSAFTFGQSAPAPANPPQQNGMNTSFSQSSTPAFGGFGATATQPQQNGFGGSNSFFSQPSQQSNTPSFSFGQSQPSQPNGTTTPTTSFGASQPTNQNGTSAGVGSSGFTGFGAKPAESSDKPTSFFGEKQQESSFNGTTFGQQTQENGASRASTPGFGNTFAAKAPEQTNTPTTNLFGSKPQENGNTGNGLFGFGQQKAPESSITAAAPFASISNGQKPAENINKSLFTASQPQEQTLKASLSMFGQPPSTQPTAPPTGLFGSTPTSSISAPGTGLFGSKPTPSEPAKSTGSIFDNLPKKDSSALKFNFSSADPKQVYNGEDDAEDTPGATADKAVVNPPAKSPFATFDFQSAAKPAAKPPANIFANNAANQDTTMTTPLATPQKSLFSSTPSTTSAPVSSTPATQPPRSLFDRVDKPHSVETPKAPLFSSTPAPPSNARPLFSSAPAATPAPPLFQQPSAAPEEENTPKAAAPKNLFAQSAYTAPFTPAAPPTAPLTSFKALPATAPVARTLPDSSKNGQQVTSSSSATPSVDLNESQKKSLKALNEGLLVHMQSLKNESDWGAVFRFALMATAQITGRPAPSDIETNVAPPAQAAPSSIFGNRPSASGASSSDSSTVATTAPASASIPLALFAQTPTAAPSASLFSKAPATAPSKKRSLPEDADESSRAPATEKRSKPNEPASYPKLPETASNTAKLFASTLDKPVAADSAAPAASSGFTPSTKLLFSGSASTSAPTLSSGGFKPSLGNAATPSAGGFKPTLPAAAPGSNFLSSFGALAKKNEEVERQKRKDADYDSDEETEEQWAKRDAAEQEEKRRRFEEAAKSVPSFKIGPATPKPAATVATAATVEKAQSASDKKPENPLQFGHATAVSTPAAAPPKLGSLFGNAFSSAATPAASSTLAPPPTSSLNASRATTPGATTDGEGSSVTNGDKATADDGEPSDEQNQPQASEEINDLQPAEREANEVLLEVQDVRTSKMEKDEDSGKQTWKPKTRGRFFILKDKKTGKVRMLSRTGAGRTVLNHMPNKEATFKVHPKKATMIVAALFVDHMHSTPPGPGQWMFSTPDKDDAEKIARLLTEGTPK